MDNQWADIPGFPDYIIHRDSMVKRLVDTQEGKQGMFVKQYLTSNGYVKVFIRNRSGQLTERLVHRLVYLSFSGATYNLDVVHKDGDRTNNSFDNLITKKREKPKGLFNKFRIEPRLPTKIDRSDEIDAQDVLAVARGSL